MKSFILISLLLLIVSCLPPHTPLPYYYMNSDIVNNGIALKTIRIWEDKNFGNADKISIMEAVEQWNYALNGYVKLVIVSTEFDMQPDVMNNVVYHNAGWLFLKVDSSDERANKNAGVLAYSNMVSGYSIKVIRDRIGNEDVEPIMLHEIGHLLGSDHHQGYLMAPHYDIDTYRCIDYQSLESVALAQHLLIERLNYCVYGYR